MRYVRRLFNQNPATVMFIYFAYVVAMMMGGPLVYMHIMPVWVFAIMGASIIPAFLLYMFGMYVEDFVMRWITRKWPVVLDKNWTLTRTGHINNGLRSYVLADRVQVWCTEHCTGYYGVHSEPVSRYTEARLIWFSNPHDAMHFKLRWV